MKLKIEVRQVWCHPEFGGEKINSSEYELSDFAKAEKAYLESSKDDCAYSHTMINIIHKD